MLQSSIKQFRYYKQLADKSMAHMSEADMHHQHNADENSIAILIKHLSGNMLSRWSNIFEEDGEKPFRNRDVEFETTELTKAELLTMWESGWNLLFATLVNLTEAQLSEIIFIRNEGLTVSDAIIRQLCHYSYHCGQIVYKSKQLTDGSWQSLSIPKNESVAYNQTKFNQPKKQQHFLDDLLDQK
jgi:Protein of unknown function (DUF1572)